MPQRPQISLRRVIAFLAAAGEHVNDDQHFSFNSGNQVWKFSCIGLSSQDAKFEFVAYEIFSFNANPGKEGKGYPRAARVFFQTGPCGN